VAVARADPPEAKPYGVRVYSVTDPGVHAWSFWQHLRDEVELPEGWKEVRNPCPGGGFTTDLSVDPDGLVLDYPGLVGRMLPWPRAST
jgi:hypothetical protein